MDAYPLSHASLVEAATKDEDLEVILIMGESRSGKSKLINLLSRSNLATGRGFRSCTNHIQLSRVFDLKDSSVMLVDTPGLEHCTKGESEIFEEVATLIAGIQKERKTLRGMIYVMPLNKNCMSATAIRNFTLCATLFGEAAFKHIVIATTVVDRIGDGVRAKLEARLQGPSWALKPFLDKGVTFKSHVDLESGRDILGILLDDDLNEGEPITTKIQEEMNDEGKKFHETSIGKLLVYGTEMEILYSHEKEMRNLTAENAKLRAELASHYMGFGTSCFAPNHNPSNYPSPLTAYNPHGDYAPMGNPVCGHSPHAKCYYCIGGRRAPYPVNNCGVPFPSNNREQRQFCGQCSSLALAARTQHFHPPFPSCACTACSRSYDHETVHMADVEEHLSQ